jgi:perosamine synthetase
MADMRAIVDVVGRVCGGPAALHEPEFAGSEWDYVKDCIDTGWVSSVGAYVDRFEAMLRGITGADHAVACVNGTSALSLAMLAAGVARDDEVIVPGLSFVATANAAAHLGAVPHFADCEAETLALDPARLAEHLSTVAEPLAEGGVRNRATGRRISAVVVTHVFGHPADTDGLAALCDDFGLIFVEDAAEGLGSTRAGRHVGTMGRAAALSFNGNKIVTTGGGGAVVTNDANLARTARHLSTTAKQATPYEFVHDAVGYNLRLPNLNAAMGCAQLERLDGMLRRKRVLAERYAEAFAAIAGAAPIAEPAGCVSNFWLNAVLLDDAADRDPLLWALNDAGLQARAAWRPLHMLAMYADNPRADMAATEDLAARIVCLPSSAGLGGEA